jgi:hypothetical protein
MKNWKQSVFFGMVTIIALIFNFISCDNGNGDKDLTGTITINPSMATSGTELTAVYSGNEAINYQWNKDGTAIDGKIDEKFTPYEIGSYTVTVRANGYNSKTSTAIKIVTTKFEGTWKNNTLDVEQYVFEQNTLLIKVSGKNDSKGIFTFNETELDFVLTHRWQDNEWNVRSPNYLGGFQYNFIDNDTFEIGSLKNPGDVIPGIYERQ